MFLEHSLTMIDLSLSRSVPPVPVYQGHVVTFDLFFFHFVIVVAPQLIVG